MAVRLQVPLIPVHLHGLERVLPPDGRWPRRGKVRVRFGAPLRFIWANNLDPIDDLLLGPDRFESFQFSISTSF